MRALFNTLNFLNMKEGKFLWSQDTLNYFVNVYKYNHGQYLRELYIFVTQDCELQNEDTGEDYPPEVLIYDLKRQVEEICKTY